MPSPLIAPEELAEALRGARPPSVLDVRWALGGPPGLDGYRAGHIPGARFVDLDRELSGPPGPGRHPLPAAEAVTESMRAHGVDADRPVVAYAEADAASAARAWWVLSHFGHPEARVLDGGLRAWREAGLPVTIDEPPVTHGSFTARAGHRPVLDAAGAAAMARRGVLLDARSARRFRGEDETVDPVAGHIPGARSAPYTDNADDRGRLLDAEVLRRRFAQAGIHPGSAVGVYCGSGVTAAHEVLALSLAGVEAALYVGSWSDWITDPRRPVATGDA